MEIMATVSNPSPNPKARCPRCRWAMEIMTISEYSYYQDNMRNNIIMTFKGLGKRGGPMEAPYDGIGLILPEYPRRTLCSSRTA